MAQTGNSSAGDRFRARFLAGELLIGTFLKTPSVHATEILGDLGFDFVVVDEEHAPFDRSQTELILLAAKASGTAAIVRVPDQRRILGALDDGAAGILVPHISSAASASAMVEASRYRDGKRGFSNSPRAGRYGGLGMWPHVDRQDAIVSTIAMIEDPEALDDLDGILATPGLDGIFIGRGDLTVALGAKSLDAPEVRAAVDKICAAARPAGKPVCVMVSNAAEARQFRELGATAFIVATDQAFMRKAAAEALNGFKDW